ncbi:photosynthetic complex putative assembly protein PuhB [Pseudahrensia aquimaris]|uniref:Photosynthetic complex putative assembly protein PuhB n=1 Tax=Pseudahrensia aquimaris TaxID=744461 RepID=A0ABW3FH42_9HYPH
MSHHDDFQTEPVLGLPANLPEGEHIVWQGAPDRATTFRTVFKGNWLIAYFVGLAGWRLATGIYDGRAMYDIAGSVFTAFVLGAVVLAILFGISTWIARSTVYTITNKRVVMRIGMALPITFNLPFSQISSASVVSHGGKSGTVALTLAENTKITWPVLWPHARPWKLANPQPAFRALGDVETAKAHLVSGLREAHGIEGRPAMAAVAAKKAKPAKRTLRGLETKGA